jgi:hypothetical protein
MNYEEARNKDLIVRGLILLHEQAEDAISAARLDSDKRRFVDGPSPELVAAWAKEEEIRQLLYDMGCKTPMYMKPDYERDYKPAAP